MPETVNPADGGALNCQLGGDRSEHNVFPPNPQQRAGRLARADASITSALRVLRSAGEPGYPSPGEIAAGLAAVLRARLGPSERLTVASAAMLSLDGEAAGMLAEATLHDVRAGYPLPPFQGLRNEARHWAALASSGELKTYMASCWHRLPEREQAGFLRAIRPVKRRAAA